MDERLQKALDFSNFMTTLNNQKRALKEKFVASCIFYQNGSTFTVNKELINFTKTLIDTGNDTDVVLIDDNDLPVQIADLNVFWTDIVNIYFSAANQYYSDYQSLKKSRTIEGLVQ